MPPELSVKPGRKVQDIYDLNVNDEDLWAIMGLTWSDDLDPNSSIKSNRGALWISTVTFVTQTFTENKLDDTYAISIGFK